VKKAIFLLAIVVVLSSVSVSNAGNIFYVDVNSPNDPGTGSFNDPFRRIQDAIDDVNDNDTVKIRPGLYTGQGNCNLDLNGKSIAIRSIDPNDLNVVSSTIIDPNKAGRGFYFHSGEDANCVISGFTLRNGYTDGSGGAFFFANSDPTIRNCVIIGNMAALGGGGIHCYYSNPTLKNCVIAGNMTQGNGGGIWCFKSSSSRIINCTISSNEANWYGDGIYCHVSNVIITNSIFWSNNFNDIYVASGNADVNYCNIQSGWVGGGNIDQDPCFVSFDPNSDANLWDFHLQSAYGRWDCGNSTWVNDVNTSPCIDAGDPNSEWSGELWPNGKRINMGAYGGTNQASKNGNIADFDVSGTVDSIDLNELASKWLDEDGGIANLDLTGRVDFADFSIFAENWLWKKN